ncbi:hypothetical protein NQ314_005061 [Rhamnusium bicolor]|uniref:Lysophospholipid acyltransferase 5 n=1 Tax=Rhamnusium bicolor TaxID=1586634 RepID=A0AAV8ZJU3_9CUCU|nr:hypothetical protein NQ314_005061 [Rhamnusium bicolor]
MSEEIPSGVLTKSSNLIGVTEPALKLLLTILAGYIYSSTDDYDINWTMPHCILVLRLIGITYDLYDGYQPSENLSADSKLFALQKRPTLLEIFGHCFFPASFLVGPQFPMKRYQEFVSGNYSKKDAPNEPPDCIEAAVKRLSLGISYLIIFQVLGLFVSDDYLLTDEFSDSNFFRKMLLLGIWGRFTLYKYISCWLLTEGACILFGLAHNGVDENGETKWDGLENIKISIFENTTEFNHYIQSFNVNTNHWVGQYVYKRLKFLGNRQLSQFAALLFLAIWHGFHTGYYVCFFFEFIVIYMERDMVDSFLDHALTDKDVCNVSDGNALCGISMLLEGQTSTWWIGIKNTLDIWDSAVVAFREAFSRKLPPYLIFREIFLRDQGAGESTESFVCRMRSLLSQLPYELRRYRSGT